MSPRVAAIVIKRLRCDQTLRGLDGYRQVEVNAGGRPVSDVKTVEPEAGNTLVLTIDTKLQQALENAMDETIDSLQPTGAVVFI